jgi:nucleoside-diphosphate-sugar epimerase
MRNAVITGGTGPLGVALTELLMSKGIEVAVLARSDSVRLDNIPRHPSVRVIRADLSQMAGLEYAFDRSYEAFFHLGWTNTANHVERENVDGQFLNARYAMDAVRLAHKLGCAVFVGAGSQSEYGAINGPITESTAASPIEPYGIAKLSAMGFCGTMCARLGIRFGWLRILSIYGPFDRDTTFVSYCVSELLRKRSPKLTKCEQIWDYLYSKDAATAFWLLATVGKPNAVYALSAGAARPLRHYAEIIRDAVNPGISLEFGAKPYPLGQRMRLTADITPLRRDLGFAPAYSFESGIAETVEYWKERKTQ